jgi:hypothetical protein
MIRSFGKELYWKISPCFSGKLSALPVALQGLMGKETPPGQLPEGGGGRQG